MIKIILIVWISLTYTSIVFGEEGTDSMSIGPRFHNETGFGDSGVKGKKIIFGRQLPLYKSYENSPKIKLPEAASLDTSLGQTIKERKSIRDFVRRPLETDKLAALLLAADGITGAGNGFARRSAPSGGALYPIEIYIIADSVRSLAKGIYHFQVSDSSLEMISEGDFNDVIHRAANNQEAVGKSPLTLILTARFERSTEKYADRGYRYTYMESGAICQNIYLAATALSLGTVAVGAFNDDAVNEMLGIDGREEAALLIMPVGFPKAP